jgi:glycosyltransferase involved in cell wall biosynthesis
MHIAQVSLQFEATSTGGGGVHVEKVTKYLRQMGHQVTVLSIHTDKTLAAAPELYPDGHWSQETRDDLTVVRFLIERGLDGPYVGDKHTELTRIYRFSQAVAAWLKQRAATFDTVHLHGHHAVPGWLAWALRACPEQVLSKVDLSKVEGHSRRDQPFRVVSTVHYLESTNVSATRGGLMHYKISEPDLAQMTEWEALARFADVTVVISPGMKQDFLDLLDRLGIDSTEARPRLQLVSSGVDPESMRPRAEVEAMLATVPDPVEVLTFARLDPIKGIEYAIRGAAQAAELTRRRFRLTVAGVPEEPIYIPVLEREIEAARRVLPVEFTIFDHIFTFEERDPFLDRFHLYLFPSLRELFGMTVVEVGARGLPVVTADSPGPVYILDSPQREEYPWGTVTDYGVLARRTNDPERNLAPNIAQALAWALENWETTATQALAFHQRVQERFTWPKVTEEYLVLYQGE